MLTHFYQTAAAGGSAIRALCGAIVVLLCLSLQSAPAADDEFPPELTEFTPYEQNPIFEGEGPGHWDARVRERGWILREDDKYYLWFTGYDGTGPGIRRLGLATSSDGLHWKRYDHNPLDPTHWIEDMMVLRAGDTYYMAAEGRHDIAQLLTSSDRVNWIRQGSFDVRLANGKPIPPGPYGTPTLWKQGDTWHLYYERKDAGIWLATSKDMRVWTNVSDDPVIACGPADYDRHMVAMDQVIGHKGRYYALYHSNDGPKRPWVSNLAVSDDLVHWKKYPRNPLMAGNQSSPIYVYDGTRYRLYIMHEVVADRVRVYFSREASPQ